MEATSSSIATSHSASGSSPATFATLPPSSRRPAAKLSRAVASMEDIAAYARVVRSRCRTISEGSTWDDSNATSYGTSPPLTMILDAPTMTEASSDSPEQQYSIPCNTLPRRHTVSRCMCELHGCQRHLHHQHHPPPLLQQFQHRRLQQHHPMGSGTPCEPGSTPQGAFDPYDWNAFYFPKMSRDEAARVLSEDDVQIGTFLLRDSSRGSYSLSVRESDDEMRVRHYLIEKTTDESGAPIVKIAEQTFVDLPMLLNHFKLRILDKSSLSVPYRKRELEKVVTTYRFEGERDADLSFEVGEVLEIIGKPEVEWWQARNAMQQTGLIPATYVVPADADRGSRSEWSSESSGVPSRHSGASINEEVEIGLPPELPTTAYVVHDRTPNVYDTTALKLRKGQQIEVLRKVANGFYEGIVEGKQGTFPHTYVRWQRE